MVSRTSFAEQDPRIAPIHRHIADGKTICSFGQSAALEGKIQYSVASQDLNVEQLVEEVDRFYHDRMKALIVLAPSGFNARHGEVERIAKMAVAMNKAIWMAFARVATRGTDWTENDREERWSIEQRAAEIQDCAVLPRDNETSYNIQAMGPWYINHGHYRYAPEDLFLLLTSMKAIKKLQEVQKKKVEAIRRKAFASSNGLVDFQKLVVPETLEELPPVQQTLIRLQRGEFTLENL